MKFRNRRGSRRMGETRRDRRDLAREAGLGRLSVVSLLGGVAAAVSAFALLMGAAAAATAAVDFDTDLMSQEWKNIDAPDAAILSVALFLACLFGGYVAGRMARRTGLSHGFYTFALGVVLLVGAIAGLDQMAQGDALVVSFERARHSDGLRHLARPVRAGRSGVDADCACRRVPRVVSWARAGTRSSSHAPPTRPWAPTPRPGSTRGNASAVRTEWSMSVNDSVHPSRRCRQPQAQVGGRRKRQHPRRRHPKRQRRRPSGSPRARCSNWCRHWGWICVLFGTRPTEGSASSRWTAPTD